MTQIGTKLLEEPGDSALEQIIARTEQRRGVVAIQTAETRIDIALLLSKAL